MSSGKHFKGPITVEVPTLKLAKMGLVKLCVKHDEKMKDDELHLNSLVGFYLLVFPETSSFSLLGNGLFV